MSASAPFKETRGAECGESKAWRGARLRATRSTKDGTRFSAACLVLVAVVRVGVVGVDGVRIVVRTRAAPLGCRQHGDLVLAPLVPEGSGLVRVLHVPVGVRR